MAVLRKRDRSGAEQTRCQRRRRRLRRAGAVVVVGLAVIGVVGVVRTFADPPEVGHFRSAAGFDEYRESYGVAMAELPEPTAVRDVPTSFGTVRVYEWSTPATEGTVPVVLIPGRSSGVPMWEANVVGFAAKHRVLAFDALGDAGLSVQAVPLASMDDQGAWISEVVRELAPGGAHVVGHSFGGATAAAFARTHPEQVRSLTLLEPVFTFAYPPPRMMWWSIVASIPGMPEPVRDHALLQIGGAEESDSADPMARMISAATAHYAAELPTPTPLSDEQAARLSMPVYVAIAGQDSVAGGEGAAGHARELLPDVTVQVWPDATHSLPMQEAASLDGVLAEFWAAAER